MNINFKFVFKVASIVLLLLYISLLSGIVLTIMFGTTIAANGERGAA